MRAIITAFLAISIFVSGLAGAFSQQLSGTPRWSAAQFTVTTTPILVAPSRPTRWQVKVAQGVGTVQVNCGPANTVSAANGHYLAPVVGSSITIDTTGEVWCVSASSQVVSVMENY